MVWFGWSSIHTDVFRCGEYTLVGKSTQFRLCWTYFATMAQYAGHDEILNCPLLQRRQTWQQHFYRPGKPVKHRFQTIWQTLNNFEVVNTDYCMEQIGCNCGVICIILYFNSSLADSSISIFVISGRFDHAWFIKKWSLFAGYLDIACRYSFCRSSTPSFSASSGDTVIFFLLNKRPYLSRRLICDVLGKLLRCTTPSNSNLCCISDTYVLGVMCFCTSMYSRTFVSLLGSAKWARGIRIDETVT